MIPKSGDPCARSRCRGWLHVYCSRRSAEFVTRYLRCRKCGTTAGSIVEACSTNPRECSTQRIDRSRQVKDDACMNATENMNDWPWLTCWEASQFLGIDPMNVLAGWEDATLPAPRSLSPLRWHEDDLGRHWLARQTEGPNE